jgi:hypothetical protein
MRTILYNILLLLLISCSKSKVSNSNDWKVEIKSGRLVERNPNISIRISEIANMAISDEYIANVSSAFYKDGFNTDVDLIVVEILKISYGGYVMDPVVTCYFDADERLTKQMINSKSDLIKLEPGFIKFCFSDTILMVYFPDDFYNLGTMRRALHTPMDVR